MRSRQSVEIRTLATAELDDINEFLRARGHLFLTFGLLQRLSSGLSAFSDFSQAAAISEAINNLIAVARIERDQLARAEAAIRERRTRDPLRKAAR